MTEFPSWALPFADELAQAENLGFRQWTFTDDAAIAEREVAAFVDQLYLFRHLPEAGLSYRHRSSAVAEWRKRQHALMAGASTAVLSTPFGEFGTVLAEVETWSVEP